MFYVQYLSGLYSRASRLDDPLLTSYVQVSVRGGTGLIRSSKPTAHVTDMAPR